MKSIILSICLSLFAYVAVAEETLTVDVTKLTRQQLELYQALKANQSKPFDMSDLSPDKIDKYSQIGKAFGSAFKECWSAISTDAEKFAQSDAGKWAMFLVSWKIMGQDAIGIVNSLVRYTVGIGLLIVGVPFFIYIFRRNCVEFPIIKSKTRTGFWTVKTEYNGYSKPLHPGEGQLLYALVFAIFIGIVSIILFA